MILKITFLFCLIFSSWGYASEPSCFVPNKSQLLSFFNNHSQWTETKSADSLEMEQNKTLRIFVNFDNALKSQFFKGKTNMGDIRSICMSSNYQTLFIQGGGRIIKLFKMKNGGLKSEIIFLGIRFTYFYKPDSVVIRKKISTNF